MWFLHDDNKHSIHNSRSEQSCLFRVYTNFYIGGSVFKNSFRSSSPPPATLIAVFIMAAATAAQINTLPEFSGKNVTLDQLDLYFDQVTRASTAFNWTEEQTATAVKSKLIGSAALYVRARARANEPNATWAVLKATLTTAYAPRNNTLAASKALADLRQGPEETIIEFYSRVTLALDLKNFRTTAAVKREQDYLDQLALDEFLYVHGGMRASHRQKHDATANAPDTIGALITWVQTIEAGDATTNDGAVAAISAGRSQPGSHAQEANMEAEIAALTNQLKNLQRRVGGPAKQNGGQKNAPRETRMCYECKKIGHISRDCYYRKNKNDANSSNASNHRNGNGNNNGNRYNSNNRRNDRHVREIADDQEGQDEFHYTQSLNFNGEQ